MTDIPAGMLAYTVPQAEYAIFEHHRLMDKMHQTYEYIYSVWLQENGYVMAEADALEIYDQRFEANEPDSIFENWVPIKKA